MGKNFCSLPISQRADIQNLQRTQTDLQEKKNPLKNAWRSWQGTFQKKTYEANKHIKNTHHHWSFEKCNRDTISHQLEWQSLKKSGDNKCWRECGVQPLWKTVWPFLKDLEIQIPFDPAIPLLGIYPKDYKLLYYKDTWTCMFIAAFFTITKTWNQPKCPLMLDWTTKMWHIYSREYYAARKSHEFVSFAGT